jgi:hypothetical protein
MMVTAPSANAGNGRLYAFAVSGSSYMTPTFLWPSDPNVTTFGSGVALDRTGSTAVGRGTGGLGYYSFTRTGPNWFGGAGVSISDTGQMGVDNGTLAVGGLFGGNAALISSGADQILKPSDYTPSPDNGYFGNPVAISGNTLLVAGEPVDSSGQNGHYGYIFVKSGSSWVQQAKLVPSDLATNSSPNFDFSVALDGSTAILATTQGAYVFTQSGSTWTQAQKIPTPSSAPNFGLAADLFGNMLVISGTELGQPIPGAVYVYAHANGTWVAGPVLSTGVNGDDFGYSVGVSQGTVAIGAPAGNGAVYLYSCQPSQ